MPYRYDVFISYRNQPGLVSWVRDHFQPLLQTWLDNEFPTGATIFRDKVSIEAGDEWSVSIKEALADSRFVIAVLTPQYFQSKWCLAEWHSLVNRGALHEQTRNKLLIPIRYSNGLFFPEIATKRQFSDATDFLEVNGTVIPPNSPQAVALEAKVKLLAKLIVDRLALAPDHQPFQIVDPAEVELPPLPQPRKPTP
jgi:hypothetical protein